MPVQTRELHPGFAAEAGFGDLSRPMDADAVAAIEAAIEAYPVLVFRDQRLRISSFAILPPASVRWRSAVPPPPVAGVWQSRRSAISPISTRTTRSAN